VWALGAACSIVACLNPMPDDFPSRRAPGQVDAQESPGRGDLQTSPPAPTDPGLNGNDGQSSALQPEAPPAPDADDTSTGPGAPGFDADAGVPVTRDGGAAADDGEL
jgi:hypothetical protein